MYEPAVIKSLTEKYTPYELGEMVLKLMWENSQLKHNLNSSSNCYSCSHFVFFDDENGKGDFGNCNYCGFGDYINESEFETLICNKYELNYC
jgi:hypothetical protein